MQVGSLKMTWKANYKTSYQKQLTWLFFYHKKCVSKYTSKSNVTQCALKNVTGEPPRKLRKSSAEFNLKKTLSLLRSDLWHCDNAKSPERWRYAFLCRLRYSEHDKKPHKEFLLDRCRARNDECASQVTIRLDGSLDMIAAEARYHRDCMCKFMALGNITRKESEADVTDSGLEAVFSFMLENKDSLLNSAELYDISISCSSRLLSRSIVIDKVEERISDDVIVLTYTAGCASIIAFKRCSRGA